MESAPRVPRRSFLELVALALFPILASAPGCVIVEPEQAKGGKGTGAATGTTADEVTVVGGGVTAGTFALGVASGDPTHERVVLWTRLVGDMPKADIVVEWIVARDRELAQVVRKGVATAKVAHGHSVRVDVDGLEPSATYFYAFRMGQVQSIVGRTKTFPLPGAKLDKSRFAVVSCQNWQDGEYAAHRHLAEEDIDFVIFLGDYIYDEGDRPTALRRHGTRAPRSLEEYRARYELYKSDPHLQAAHAAHPWIAIWDDHEVTQNYGGDFCGEEDPMPAEFDQRRAAAYKAYWEHLPIRTEAPVGVSMQLYRDVVIGDLAHLHMLDGRQFRSKPLCNGKIRPGACGGDDELISEMSMLGPTQEQWLTRSLVGSTQTWRLIGNNVLMSPFDLGAINHDQWDGYTNERERLLNVFGSLDNVVVFTGDIHATIMSELQRKGKNVGVEIVTTSMSSSGLDGLLDLVAQVAGRLSTVKYVNPRDRGYLLCDLTHDHLDVKLRAVNDVRSKTSDITTVAGWTVRKGKPEILRVS